MFQKFTPQIWSAHKERQPPNPGAKGPSYCLDEHMPATSHFIMLDPQEPPNPKQPDCLHMDNSPVPNTVQDIFGYSNFGVGASNATLSIINRSR